MEQDAVGLEESIKLYMHSRKGKGKIIYAKPCWLHYNTDGSVRDCTAEEIKQVNTQRRTRRKLLKSKPTK